MAPGTTAQFTLNGNYSDGSTKDVSASASWNTFPTNILRSAGGGRVEALAGGDAQIFVNFDRRFTFTGSSSSAGHLQGLGEGHGFKRRHRERRGPGSVRHGSRACREDGLRWQLCVVRRGRRRAPECFRARVRRAGDWRHDHQSLVSQLCPHDFEHQRRCVRAVDDDVPDVVGVQQRLVSDARQREITAAITSRHRLTIRFLGPTVRLELRIRNRTGTNCRLGVFHDAVLRRLLLDLQPDGSFQPDRVGGHPQVLFEGVTNSPATEIDGTFHGLVRLLRHRRQRDVSKWPRADVRRGSTVQLRR